MRIAFFVLAGLAGFYLLAQPLLRNEVVVVSDLGRAHLPSRNFYQRCLQSGDDYFWCPGQFCGYFIHGEGQGGYDHPLHRALYSLLPLTTAFNLEVFWSFPFLLAGMYLFLRRHELPRDAVLFGALSFTFSGFTMSHWQHVNAIAIVAHIPWLLWAIDILWKTESRRVRAAALFVITILTASQVLIGYPQYLLFSGIAEGLYVITLLRVGREWPRLGHFVVAKLLGIMAGAAQLLPTLQALQDSPRMDYSREFCGSYSLNPANLLQLVNPAAFNEHVQFHEYTVYAGAFATVALVVWLIQPRIPASTLGRWALTLLVTTSPLAFGKYTALFDVYLKLPVFRVFRCPCRYVVLVHLATAVFMAMAVREYSVCERKPSWRRLTWILAVPFAAWAVVLFASGGQRLGDDMRHFMNPVSYDPSWRIERGAIVLTIATALGVLAIRGQRIALTILMLLTIADQIDFGMRTIRLCPTADVSTMLEQEVAPPGPVTGRVEIGDVYGNTLNMKDTSLTSGYVGLRPVRRLDYTKVETQQLAGTRWRHDGKAWQPVGGAQPRVRMVCEAKRSDDARHDLATIDPAKVVLLDCEIALPTGVPGRAEITVDRPGHVEVATHNESAQVLVFTESFHRSWRATIDGKPVDILRAYGDFQACVVPAGEHRITFHFDPASVRWGRRLSIAGLFCAVGLVFWMIRAGLVTTRA